MMISRLKPQFLKTNFLSVSIRSFQKLMFNYTPVNYRQQFEIALNMVIDQQNFKIIVYD